MGQSWCNASSSARAVFAEADAVLGPLAGAHGRSLSEVCAQGPAEILNRTDISQPALFTCAIACARALDQSRRSLNHDRAANARADAVDNASSCCASGLSLGEYTALCLAGAYSFTDGLRIVAARGALMQQAAEQSGGGMVALIGADDLQAQALCDAVMQRGASGSAPWVLVPANFNAPGQVVVSGSIEACDVAAVVAGEMGLRAARLSVAGAFHSPLMAAAAEGMKAVLAAVAFQPLQCRVWSNVTAKPHDPNDSNLLKGLLVQQITSAVRWSQSCADMLSALGSDSSSNPAWVELAPGAVLKGLMRRIDRSCEVTTNDQPSEIKPKV